MNTPPVKSSFSDENNLNRAEWTDFMSSAFRAIQQDSQFGITAKRPVNNLRLWMRYGDTTLGYPVYLKSTRPNVWVNGAGAVV